MIKHWWGKLPPSYRPLFYVMAEQALSSLTNFGMVLVLLVLFTPTVLGHFTYVFTLVMVVSSLQYGLVLLPTLVHVSPLSDADAAEALDVIGNFELVYRAIGTVIITAGSWFVSSDPWDLVATAAFGSVFMWRETVRSVFFATDQSAMALRQAVVAFVIFVPSLAVLLLLGASFTAPVLAFAVSQGVALRLFAPKIVRKQIWPTTAVLRHLARFKGVRWSVTSSAANEVQMRSHVFAVEALRGVDQVGILEAGRVLWSPLLIGATALQKLLQPSVAKAQAEGDTARARRWVGLSCIAIFILSGLYMGTIYLSFDFLTHLLFREHYDEIARLVAAWAVYTVLLITNWTLISFLNALHAFRAVATVTMAAAASTLALLMCLFWPVPLIAVIGILIAVQVGAMAGLLWLILRTRRASESSALWIGA